MLLLCNAKINLGLSIISKREDGFHNLESIFLPVPWYDTIELTLASKTSFSAEGISISGDPNVNLSMKAYHLLATDFLLSPVHIHLNKQVPIGAGLGGGSSDAAFVLKGLNELFGLNLSIERLEQYADQLGSDCSFFIQNRPAFVSGKGEVLEPIHFQLSGYCLLVNPNIHISTKEAYQSIIPKQPSVKLKEAIQLPKERWPAMVKNDFEEALIHHYPELKKLREKLEKMGAYYVAMSGSGSTYFAFFEKLPDEISFGDYQVKSFSLDKIGKIGLGI